MKLLGRDIPARELISRIEERLRTRGLPTSEPVEVPAGGVEPRVEPLTFNLHALEENADATRALPLHTHRGGAGQLVLVAKWAFRKSCQVFINEALGRQRVFNGHVRDSYAQLSAEVIRLRREVEELKARGGSRPYGEERRPMPAQSSPMAKVAQTERKPEASAKMAPAATQIASDARESVAKAVPVAKQPASEERASAVKAGPSDRPSPATERARRPGEFPPVGGSAAPASERNLRRQGPASAAKAPSAQQATPAREARSSRGAVSPSRPPTSRRNTPAAKTATQAKPASHRKPTPETTTTPPSSGEPVLPKPRHTRAGENQSSRAQDGASRARPETGSPASTSTAEKAGQGTRKPGSKGRGRRK
ncbi:hypothetical protein ACLESD_08200 [Pyxidicoccus sp. 3LFB2]